MSISKRVIKSVLSNGLTVLIHQKPSAPKVALQMWYNVGSKHEQPSEKGMAHFLEHMVFKGTQNLLSESDINAISQKLAAYANAFTSYDYTAYVFDVPVANWDQLLPIYADCMQHCSFLQEHMNSEVKAVIQELKMYRDDFHWTLADGLITNIFESHPYHYPIIGYKQDLWNLKRETFLKFYQKYYVPNNATFVVVGDVNPDEALLKIEKAFGSIPRGNPVHHPEYFFNDDVVAKSFSVYRELEQPFCMMAFVVPGAQDRKDFIFDIVGTLLANGKGSRLYQKLVDQLGLVTSVSCMTYDLFDRGVFFVEFKPKNEQDIPKIKSIIMDEIYNLANTSIPEEQMRRALKVAQIDYQHLLEDTHKQAYAIGKSFVALGDEEYPFNYCNYNKDTIEKDIQDLMRQYFRSSLCNYGEVVRIKEEDKSVLNEIQQKSDELDTKILSGKERETSVEEGRFVHKIAVKKLQVHDFPVAQEKTLENGLKVLLYHNQEIDLVENILKFKTDFQYDEKSQQGMSHLVAKMMLEGTKQHPGASFVQEIESYGIIVNSSSGSIEWSSLSQDVAKGFSFVGEMVQDAQFDATVFDKLKQKTAAQIIQFWDTPNRSIGQIASQEIYGNHPYANMALGSAETLANISTQDAFDYYKKMISPYEATLVVVGNFNQDTIMQEIQKHFASWQGSVVADLDYPEIASQSSRIVDIEKNRDQVVLAFVGNSVDRLHKDYDALSVFNQLLTVGMNSYLFELREQTGLFYTIGGSLVHHAGKQPGMIFIRTIVSKDRMLEAQKVIAQCLDTSIDLVTPQSFDEAKEMVISSFPSMFETYEDIANTFLFLNRYKLPQDYLQQRITAIRSMSLEHMKSVVNSYLNSKKLLCIRIGRIK